MALTRSQNMSRIRARNTKPEILVRKELWARGVRYRTDFRTPGGRADIAIPARQFAVFVDGCFWHGCPEHYVRPKSSKDFWDKKLKENLERDTRGMLRLLAEGWTVVRLWEHEIREAPQVAIEKTVLALGSRKSDWPLWRVERVDFLEPDGSFERRHLRTLIGGETRQEESRRQTAKKGRVLRGRGSIQNLGDQ